MKTVDEVRGARKALADEIAALAEKDELTAEEEARFDELGTLYETADADVAKAEARAELEARARQAAAKGGALPGDARRTFEVGTKVDPFDTDLRSIRMNAGSGSKYEGEVRSRARAAIEQADDMTDEARETAERNVARLSANVAEHVLATGRPEYVEQFYSFLRYERTGLDHELRAALAESSTHGTELVPFFLDPTIILTNNGAINPFRDLATVDTITTNAWHGVTSAGVTAEWIGEAAEVADASPTFTQPSIPIYKADAYIQASMEVVQDTNVASQLSRLIADAKDRLESTAFAVGTGSSQPRGIVTALGATTASRVTSQTNGSFGAIDVFNIVNALPPRYRPNSSWVAEQSIYNVIRALPTNASPFSATFWADFGPAIPSTLLGRPTYQSSAMEAAPTFVVGGGAINAATASNDDVLVLGDIREGYRIVDRVGLSIQQNPLVLGSNRRPTGELGWVAFWRVGADLVDTNSARLLRV